jgi:exodeoxyribonuclease VII small subunit
MTSQDTLSFESAYARLEEILEKMNSGKASLEDSLKLYEEADQLIVRCHKQLNAAEKKIEILIKNREGEIVTDPAGKPQTQEFIPGQQAPLTRNLV